MNPSLTKGRNQRPQLSTARIPQAPGVHLGDAEAKKPVAPRNLIELDPDSYLRLKQIVPDIVPVNRGTWWKWVKDGKAPAPKKLGPAVTAWRVGDLIVFLNGSSAV